MVNYDEKASKKEIERGHKTIRDVDIRQARRDGFTDDDVITVDDFLAEAKRRQDEIDRKGA